MLVQTSFKASTCGTDVPFYVIGAGCYCGSVDNIFKLALSLNWAAVFCSAVACGSWVGVLVQQSFVVSVNDGLNVRATTIRNLEGFSIE